MQFLIEARDLSTIDLELMDELTDFLDEKLPDLEIELKGDSIIIDSGAEVDFSKRKIRFLLRKFVYKQELKGAIKVISGGVDSYILKKRKEVELEGILEEKVDWKYDLVIVLVFEKTTELTLWSFK